MGPNLEKLPDISWEYVKKEKSEDMIHVLQFPYNGETPRVSDLDGRSCLLNTEPNRVADIKNRIVWLKQRSPPTRITSFAIMAVSQR